MVDDERRRIFYRRKGENDVKDLKETEHHWRRTPQYSQKSNEFI